MLSLLLLALALSLVSADHHLRLTISPEEVDGDWQTVAIASDNDDKTREGGPLRAYLKNMYCTKGCQKLFVTFHVRLSGECQEFQVVSEKEENGLYTTDYSGENYFQFLKKTAKHIILSSVNVDETGNPTRVVLVAGREAGRLDALQIQELEDLVEAFGIPRTNVHLISDTC